MSLPGRLSIQAKTPNYVSWATRIPRFGPYGNNANILYRSQKFNPRRFPGLQAWYDVSDVNSMRNDAGSVPTNGQSIKLISDKSGNSSVNVLCLNGVAGNYASTPNIAYPSTEFEAEVGLSCPDWTPAANMVIWGKDDGATARIARMIIVTTGTIQLQLSVNGTAFTSAISSASVPFSDYSFGYIKATWRASDGRVQFFTSTDGVTFSQLGTDQTIAIASIFNASRITEIGSVVAGTSTLLTANVGYVTLRSTIGGSNFLNFRASAASKLATSVTGVGTGETWTINTSGATGARISGARDLYQGTAANQPILTIAAAGNYLTFDGSNDYLKAAAFSLPQPLSVYGVFNQLTWTTGDYFFDGGSAISTVLYQNSSTPQIRLFAGTDSTVDAGLAVATNAVVTSVFNGASSATRVNRTTATVSNAGAQAANGFTLGGSAAGLTLANITAQEVALFSTAQNTAQQDAMILYAGRKWGIAV